MLVYIALLALVYLIIFSHEKIIIHQSSNQIISDDFFKKQKQISFFIIFLILATFSAVRDGIGIDYSSYLIHIENIALGYPNYMEIGFKSFSKIIMFLTGNPRVVLILMSYLTIFFFVYTIYKLSLDVKMSIFLFLTWGYYFVTFNTVRNYFALSLIFFAIIFLLNKKYIYFIILVLIAATFHKTALICLPFYFIMNRKFKLKTCLIVIFSSLLFLLFKDLLRELVFWIYPHYENSVYDDGSVSYLNIMKSLAVLVFGSIYYKKVIEDKTLTLFFNLNIVALILYSSLYWIPEVSRIGYYFNIILILFIPNLLTKIPKRACKVFKILIYVASVILFILLLKTYYSSTIQLLPYKTWLFN